MQVIKSYYYTLYFMKRNWNIVNIFNLYKLDIEFYVLERIVNTIQYYYI